MGLTPFTSPISSGRYECPLAPCSTRSCSNRPYGLEPGARACHVQTPQLKPFNTPRDLPQRRVNLLQRPRSRAQLLLAELVERGLHGVEVGVEVFGVGVEVQQAGDDFAFRGVVGDVLE